MADCDNIVTTGRNTFRVEYSDPAAYRLVRRGGELLLQGRFDWTDGDKAGFNWRDIPTVVEAEAAPATSRPLWEVMQAAYFKGRNPGISEPHGYAAELRAIADWLVPEEPPYRDILPSVEGNVIDTAMHSQRAQRQDLRIKLLAEADRAEKGE